MYAIEITHLSLAVSLSLSPPGHLCVSESSHPEHDDSGGGEADWRGPGSALQVTSLLLVLLDVARYNHSLLLVVPGIAQ